MKQPTPKTNQYLHQGIEAARAGRRTDARKFLKLVLDQRPDDITALLWMAFAAPSPEEGTVWLKRVLTLEPDNEQAQAGVRWIEQRAAAQRPVPESTPGPAQEPPASARPAAASGSVQPRHRSFNPVRAVMFLLGLGLILVIGIWAVAFVPSETLAAWLPVTTAPAPPEAAVLTTKPETKPAPLSAERQPASAAVESTPKKHFTAYAETIDLDAFEPATAPVAVPDPVASSLAEPDFLGMIDARAMNYSTPNTLPDSEGVQLIGPADGLHLGPELLAPVDEALLAHQLSTPDEKWIEVDLSDQLVVAWVGNVPIMKFLTSTGLPNTPTVKGKYNIYWKLESTLMTGPGYYLPDVPYTMYFHGGYALHGTYWHDNFGQPMSHGCVNLENDNAKKLFEWADPVIPPGQTQVVSSADNPGTLVVVHD